MDIFGTVLAENGITAGSFFLCTITSLGIGFFIAFIYTLKNHYTKSFLITLALLPAIVQMVIMLVNGNIGAGVAVAGTFSLVRFRSAAGSGQEITSIFLSMAVGLATGMGYLTVAVLFAVILVLINFALTASRFGEDSKGRQILKITIPEGLDYEELFDEILRNYTSSSNLREVRTTNMGSLYKLTYEISLKPEASVRAMIDEIRTRNCNLEISCGRPVTQADAL
ncbi:MAG: DUF4956 domain-containing protein [Eubacterium sp.]|nr:DUF4956 domain-containing protein [Eubacterium sp.]